MPIDAAAAASVQGMDFDSAIAAAVVQSGEEEVESRLDRLEREHALVRFVGELEAPDRTLTLHYRFAHHIYQNAFFESLRATRKAALGRGCRAPGGSGTASRRSVSPTSRCCSKWRETACARPNIGTAPPRLLDGFTRTTNRRAWRSAGSACSRTSRTVQRARPPSSGCR